MKNKEEKLNKGEIVIYKGKGKKVGLEVKLEKDTVWLSQQQMAVLFDKNVRTINEQEKLLKNEIKK